MRGLAVSAALVAVLVAVVARASATPDASRRPYGAAPRAGSVDDNPPFPVELAVVAAAIAVTALVAKALAKLRRRREERSATEARAGNPNS